MLFTLALCAIGVGLIYVYLVWNYEYWQKRGVPGPKGYLLAGSFPQAFFQRRQMVYEMDEAYKQYRHESPFIGIYSSRTPALMILDPAMAKTIMTTNFTNFHDNEFGSSVDKSSDPLLSRNPFMLSGEEWKEKRSEVTPAFTNSRLKAMYSTMDDVSKQLSAHVRSAMEHKSNLFDAKDLCANYTTEVVANCIYSLTSNALTGKRSEIREMGTALFDFPVHTMIYFAVMQVFPWISRIFPVAFISKKITNFFEQITMYAIEQRTKGNIKRDDFLNYLLQVREKKGLTNMEITAHTMTFFLDGFETSSYVISYMLHRLAANPTVQQRLREEIESVVQPEERISFEQINDLQYLDQVFNETVRIDSAVAAMSKICTESMELSDYKDKKITVEKGIVAHIPIYSIHHDPEHYPNPEVFDPERFSPENGGVKAFRDRGTFLSFGDGPRICLGMRFATLQSKVAIVEILRNFRIKVNPKTASPRVFDPANFLLFPQGGIWIEFENIVKHT